MTTRFESAESVMLRAIEIARQGIGYVEPNPAVGAVIVDGELNLISEGFHTAFGQPHAEAEALKAAGKNARGQTIFVTLEPCQHQGKTPPCAQAVIEAGIGKVVIGSVDPAAHTSGKGIEQLRDAGLEVEVGLLQAECDRLIAPFRMLHQGGRPWVHAKWAMTLDGKTAAHTGHSQWISSAESRAIVHQVRGCMDAIIVGSGTVAADDPLLTARPAGARTPVRVVIDTHANLPLDSKLVQTAKDAPLLVFCGTDASVDRIQSLEKAPGEIEVLPVATVDKQVDVGIVLAELGKRQMTNVLLEGGGTLAGSFLDGGFIDEVHAFIATKLVGGRASQTPIGGHGLPSMDGCPQLHSPTIEIVGPDVYINGHVIRSS